MHMDMLPFLKFKSLGLMLTIGLVSLAASANGQSAPAAPTVPVEATEEIAVSLEVPKVTSKDVIVRYDGKDLYLPFLEVMGMIGSNASVNQEGTIFSGSYLSKDVPITIIPSTFKASVGGKEFTILPSECIVVGRELYLKLPLYETWFGLKMKFEFSLLRVLLPLDEKFPAYQKLKRNQAREKLTRSIEALRTTKVVPQTREIFAGGVADWLLSTNPVGGGGHYLDLNTGAVLFGGDLSLSGTGNTVSGFNAKDLSYKWHYAFDSNKYVSQGEAGYVYPGGAVSKGVRGVLVTNKPLVQRTYFQTINLSGQLQPGWEVELYVDNKLVDFVTADQKGSYSFNVDVNYGTSLVTLKKFGPTGEVETEERQMQVPYNLIPRHSVEYTVSAGEGISELDKGTRFQANSYYGLSSHITVGASADVPTASSKTQVPQYALEGTYQIMEALTAYSTLSPGNVYQGGVNYSSLTSLSANGTFSLFDTTSYRNSFKQQYNATLSLAAPFKIASHYFGARYNLTYDKYPAFNAIGMNYGLTCSLSRIYMSYIGKFKNSTYATYNVKSIASQLLISADLAGLLRPQFRIDYDHSANEITRYGIYLNRRLFKSGQLTLSYERNPVVKSNSIMLTLNFFNQFANFTSRVLSSEGRTSVNQTQRGSIRYDRIGSSLRFDRRNGVGYGSAVIRPFLDANNDGKVDNGESYMTGLKARISGIGGRARGRDQLYYYDGLRPYDDYIVQIDPTSLDDPTLKPSYENLKVKVNPNVVTSIDVPVVVAADISGLVEFETLTGKVGVGGIRLKVLNISKDVATEITTFNGGDFYYLGLVPGHYRAFLDPAQLAQYGYTCKPESIEFDVKASDKSSSIDQLNFTLSVKK
jgi:hypothetical protein